MPPAGRLFDISLVPRDGHKATCCPHVALGPAINGSGNVKINGRPALRVGDRGLHAPCCDSCLWKAATGSPTVFINGRQAHRMFDFDTHCGGEGLLVTGSMDVIIGGGVSLGGYALSLAFRYGPGLLKSAFAGSDIGGGDGFFSSAIGKITAAYGKVTGALSSVSNAISGTVLGALAAVPVLHLAGPIIEGAVRGAVSGALSGALAGGASALFSGGNFWDGVSAGARGGAEDGALNGAMRGLLDELSWTLDDVREQTTADLQNRDPAEFQADKDAKLGVPPGLSDAERADWISSHFEAACASDDFFGSELHQQFGDTVEYISSGGVSAEEAMLMSPTGGIPGPGNVNLNYAGVWLVPGVSDHAVRHDAQGFLNNEFDVGVGYGGTAPDFPGSGQVLGTAREWVNPTEFPSNDKQK